MPNVLAMSFEGELAVTFPATLPRARAPAARRLGPGLLPSGGGDAEPAPPQGSIRGQLADAWEHLESSLFLLHIRHATWGAISDANTQPFARAWGRRDWLIAHAGSLDDRLPSLTEGPFESVGSSDTEQIFCELLNRLAARGWRSLGDADLSVVGGWLAELNRGGALTLVLTDGRDLLGYADARGAPLRLGTLFPPYEKIALGDDDLELDLTRRGAKSRKGVLLCSSELTAARQAEGSTADVAIVWRPVAPGTLVVVRQGAVIAELPTATAVAAPAPARPRIVRPGRAEVRRFDIVHRTAYAYERPIERSSHLFRVRPVQDRLQQVLSHTLSVSVPGQAADFEDVFGNRVRYLEVDTPFTELVIEARSRVEVLDVDPLAHRPVHARLAIPLVWMPWQRQVLEPFLLPPELPESELAELAEYAMSFVKRNDYDLLDTLLDINASIYRDYEYKQGATTLWTTAFEVYRRRHGVCQDFTNLFICLARLLGVPARYVCGYVYTGAKDADLNVAAGEASHAWVQLYLPRVGWKGFDPTNGILTQTDHVRVAVGRNFRDATPTSGTIFVGGGPETLAVDVRVEPV
ncbi:MAG: class II glutamine amidotransferase [Kofleriaceae bacterium]